MREAIEYGIDEVSIAKTFGYGLMEAANQMAIPSSTGYCRAYKGRPYNPAQAGQLLTDAAYPDGFKMKIIIPSRAISVDAAIAIQTYLAAVGIDAQLDIADNSRFNSLTLDTTGKVTLQDSMILSNMRLDPDLFFVDSFIRYLKPGAQFTNLARSPEFSALIEEYFAAPNKTTIHWLSQVMVEQVANDTMVVPIITIPYPLVTQKYVHAKFLTAPCPDTWDMSSDWMGTKKKQTDKKSKGNKMDNTQEICLHDVVNGRFTHGLLYKSFQTSSWHGKGDDGWPFPKSFPPLIIRRNICGMKKPFTTTPKTGMVPFNSRILHS